MMTPPLKRILQVFLLLLFMCKVVVAQKSQTDGLKKVEQWNRFELAFKHAYQGNAYTGVLLSAKFTHQDTSFIVPGFYDGDGIFKIRFMPERTGIWQYETSSNITQLHQQKGSFECVDASGDNHGIVRVKNTHNFGYADGKNYYPFGTTAYAWTHMSQPIQEATINSLKQSGFNKLRICVFPKNYDLVKEEPELYPFEVKEIKKDALGTDTKVWDFEKFNPAFFRHLEKRIDNLNALGIEADLILFHPYDKGRWGFDAMPNEVNLRYIRYLLARVASYKNVWWSLANEWDLVKAKTKSDWDLFLETVSRNDPYHHLSSIHGATATYYSYWNQYITHVSIQDETPVQSPGSAGILRNIYQKPIISDEVGYEGNLKSRWGRYSGQEMTYLVWNGVIAGTYVTHGETYMLHDKGDTIFWAKGGYFRGSSWRRIAFLRKIVEACPNPLSLADISRDNQVSTAGEGYYIIYFGKQVNDEWLFSLPAKNGPYNKPKAGMHFKVDIINTWDMTIQESPLIFETAKENDYRLLDKDLKKLKLPAIPYLALRVREVK